MEFDKVMEVQACFDKIDNILDRQSNVILDTQDDKNILMALTYESSKVKENEKMEILKEVKKLEKSFVVNHIIINLCTVIFQGTLKEQ